ncbi:MAG: PIN domain nuclease [Deltaproteobacteria bacterium]|nr:PIN domain nuclease [Deltaproteobacteria bacterium]MBI4373253.1 PIN domain nuclease [Deltaproteobacteria bacterium]
MILVDTSVWIDFLSGRNSSFRHELHRLISTGTDVALTGIILQEILQGIRGDLDCRRTERHLREFTYLPLKEPDTFLKASEIYRECAKRGRKIRKPVDALIAAQAIEAGSELLHNDRDFEQVASVSPLKIYRF